MTGAVVALSGGVGGAKLALGLSQILPAEELTVVANTGDDFEHLGFYICPDIDTLLYTLGGVSNTDLGWGRADETWTFMEGLRETAPDDSWFLLGDKDLETHRFRRAALDSGVSLSSVTAELAGRFGIESQVLPMSDDPVRTHVRVPTDSGTECLPFQEYFVRLRCEPKTLEIEFRGVDTASVNPVLLPLFETATPRAVIICPSNPYLSIDPILALQDMCSMLVETDAPVIAISPVVGGKAIKGPTAKIMQELGIATDVHSIAAHYRDVIDGLVVDTADADDAQKLEEAGVKTLVTNTVMKSLEDREQLARDVLAFADSLAA